MKFTPCDEVCITGIGIASPIGIGRQAVLESLERGTSGLRDLPLFAGQEVIPKRGGAIENFQPKQYVRPRKSLKVMCREIQLAFAAGDLALADAGLLDAETLEVRDTVSPERMGVITGAPGFLFCDLDEIAPVYHGIQKGLEPGGLCTPPIWAKHAIDDLYPLWMLKYLSNLAGCHVGIHLDARGLNNTIVAGDISSLWSVVEGANAIRRGIADVVLVGGTSSQLNVTRAVWHAGIDLPPPEAMHDAMLRPFDRARQGTLYGEGAAYLVLERAEHAADRGANVVANYISGACRSEPTATTQKPTGSALERAMRAALNSAEFSPGDIGHINAHGSGTIEGDRMEAAAIARTLPTTPVTAPKSFVGTLGPGGGAVELAISLISMASGNIPATLNYSTPDPDCPIDVIREPTPTDKGKIMSINYAATGRAVATIVEATPQTPN